MGATPVPGPTMTTGTDGSEGRLNVDGRTCTIIVGQGPRAFADLLSPPVMRARKCTKYHYTAHSDRGRTVRALAIDCDGWKAAGHVVGAHAVEDTVLVTGQFLIASRCQSSLHPTRLLVAPTHLLHHRYYCVDAAGVDLVGRADCVQPRLQARQHLQQACKRHAARPEFLHAVAQARL